MTRTFDLLVVDADNHHVRFGSDRPHPGGPAEPERLREVMGGDPARPMHADDAVVA